MARPFPEVGLPDRRGVRPVHREGRRRSVRPGHREEDRQRQEARRPGWRAPRWEAELQVRIVA